MIITTIIRSVSAIILLQILTRMTGPKQISQLSFYDYVVGITLGSIAAVLAIDDSVDWFSCIIALIVCSLIALFFSYLTTKSIRCREWLTGTPHILIFHGKIIIENLNKVHFDINDLLTQCRVAGYFDLSKIEFAIMETNGHVSFLLKSEENPATIKDIGHKVQQEELMANVIIDGEIMEDSLITIGKDKTWLLSKLKEKEETNIDDIILAIANRNNDFHIFKKETINKQQYFV